MSPRCGDVGGAVYPTNSSCPPYPTIVECGGSSTASSSSSYWNQNEDRVWGWGGRFIQQNPPAPPHLASVDGGGRLPSPPPRSIVIKTRPGRGDVGEGF